MKGLELSEAFFREYGMPMLKEDFPALLPHIAVGLVGAGSECLGFDDDTSHDHDFDMGFAIFLPDESVVDRKEAFRLERAYAALPKEFMGYQRRRLSPTGGARHGVLRLSDFLTEKTGTEDGNLSFRDFLCNIPFVYSKYLLCVLGNILNVFQERIFLYLFCLHIVCRDN